MSSVREYVILYLNGKKTGGSATIGGGNTVLSTNSHALDGPEHTGQLPASRVSVEDVDGHYTAVDAEAAFTEIAVALEDHIADTTDAHDASAISADTTGFTNSAGDDVQEVLADLDAAIGTGTSSGGFVPTYIAPSETFLVPEDRQALFTLFIDNEGTLDIEGYLVEVD